MTTDNDKKPFRDRLNYWLKVAAGGIVAVFCLHYLPSFWQDELPYVAPSGRNQTAEIDGCNSDRVKRLILSGSFLTLKNSATELFSSPGNSSPMAVAALNKWTANVQNVRQNAYDPINNIRYCVAAFSYQNVPPAEILMLLAISVQDTSCEKEISYKIQPTIDKPAKLASLGNAPSANLTLHRPLTAFV